MHSLKSNIYFIHVPKTGGTALKRELMDFENLPHDHIFLSDLKLKMPTDIWNNTFKFCSLRDPYERFVSDFKQFFSRENRNFKEAGYAMGDFSVDTFRKWMENIWIPFISGDSIKTQDPKLLSWMNDNGNDDSCFVQDIYHLYLFDTSFADIDYLLDFRYMKSDLRLMAELYKQKTGSSLLSEQNNFGNIKNYGSKSIYSKYWTPRLRDIFSEYNAKDVRFYADIMEGRKYEENY